MGDAREDRMVTESASLNIGEVTGRVGYAVRRVPLDAPWNWLARGWRDLCAVPVPSLAYSAFFCVGGWVTFYALNQMELSSLIPVLAGGFLLVAPLFAAGFYEMSRRLEKGEPVTLPDVFRSCTGAIGRLSFFGIVLFFAYFLWVELSFLLLSLFLDGSEVPEASQFMQSLIFTNAGLALLFASVITGGVLAALVFSISSVAVPLLLARDVDAVTAMVTSARATNVNRGPMLLWAAIIAGHMALGLATVFVGLLVIFPLLGHATWHAFRDLVSIE
ncbi:MAG: DUF2189 domain-containing protein [Hyphomicrobium sp.]|jgi:uncharacterized membrane protein